MIIAHECEGKPKHVYAGVAGNGQQRCGPPQPKRKRTYNTKKKKTTHNIRQLKAYDFRPTYTTMNPARPAYKRSQLLDAKHPARLVPAPCGAQQAPESLRLLRRVLQILSGASAAALCCEERG